MKIAMALKIGILFFVNYLLSLAIGYAFSFGPVHSEVMILFAWRTLPISIVSLLFALMFSLLLRKVNLVFAILLIILLGFLTPFTFLFFQPSIPFISHYDDNIIGIICWIPATIITFSAAFLLFKQPLDFRSAGWITGIALGFFGLFVIIRMHSTQTITHKDSQDSEIIPFYSWVNGKTKSISLPRAMLLKQRNWNPDSNLPLSLVQVKHIADSTLRCSASDFALWHLTAINLHKMSKKDEKWVFSVCYGKKTTAPIWEKPPELIEIPVLLDGTTRGFDCVVYEEH